MVFSKGKHLKLSELFQKDQSNYQASLWQKSPISEAQKGNKHIYKSINSAIKRVVAKFAIVMIDTLAAKKMKAQSQKKKLSAYSARFG